MGLDNDDEDGEISPFDICQSDCSYYDPRDIANLPNANKENTSYFHLNCRGLASHWDNFTSLVHELNSHNFSFDFIGISETFKTDNNNLELVGYHNFLSKNRQDSNRGGVGIYIKETIQYTVREDLSIFIPHIFESVFIEIEVKHGKNEIVGVIYRPNTFPLADINVFTTCFLDLLDIINRENKQSVIIGDINIDLLQYNNNNLISAYVNNTLAHSFLPVITRPTRLTPNSATLIDHIYINDVNSNQKAGIVVNDVADHFGIFLLTEKATYKKQNEPIYRRQFHENNMANFTNIIRGYDFNELYRLNDPNEVYNHFINIIQAAYEQAFPKKLVNRNKNKIKKEPWITQGLFISSQNKAKLHKKKITSPTDINIDKYRKYNKLYNTLRRQIKKQYYEQLFDIHKSSMKQTWAELKKIIKIKNCKKELPDIIKVNNNIITDKRLIAEEYNNFFVHIGNKVNDSIEQGYNYADYMNQNIANSLYLTPTDPAEIMTIAKTLKPKTSSGNDNISSKLMLNIINYISIPFSYVVNLSFATGIVPSNMKVAKVIPIFKAGDISSINNYRPISLLPAFSKLLEKLIYKRMISFIEANNIFYKHQYGFRKKHSTIHPILHLLNHVSEASNKINRELTMAIFIDLKKAFDTISHKILLNKLERYGIRGVANDWLKSYLTDRKQFVQFRDTQSNTQYITTGIPQGSILGPLLFLLYINDLSHALKLSVLSFADDTTLYLSDSNIKTLYRVANNELNKLYKWLCANKLALNTDKTKYMIICSKHHKYDNNNLNLNINGIIINQISKNNNETSVKFLGVFLDEHLSWKNHIQYLNGKISNSLFIMNRVKRIIPKDTLKTIYYALIYPYLTYGLLAWGHTIHNDHNTLFLKQKRALRLINKAPYNSHTDPLFRTSNILKIKDLYEQKSLLFMIQFEKKQLPISFNTIFQHNRERHPERPTRQSNQIYIKMPRNTFIASLPSFTIPQIWNKWLKTIDLTKSNRVLKYNIANTLREKYHKEVLCNNIRCRNCHPH